jgi:hypothetical protein
MASSHQPTPKPPLSRTISPGCTQNLSGGSWKLHLRKARSQPTLAENQSTKADFVYGRFVPAFVAGGRRTPDFNRPKSG